MGGNFPHVHGNSEAIKQMQRYILGRASLYMMKCANIKSYITLHPILPNFHVLFAVLQFKYIQSFPCCVLITLVTVQLPCIQQLSDAKYEQQ